MPKGPGTYGSRVGRPKKRKNKMNEQELELVGESVWNTYRNMAYLLSEISAERIEQAVKKQTGRKEATVAAKKRQLAAAEDKHRGQVSVSTKGARIKDAALSAAAKAERSKQSTEKQAARVQRRAKGHPTTLPSPKWDDLKKEGKIK
jgi:hypothetical protein